MKTHKHEDPHPAALTTPECTAYKCTDVLHVPLGYVSVNQEHNTTSATHKTKCDDKKQNSFP